MQGLEAANGLMLRGMTVTVLHFTPWLMARQLDEVSGKMLQGSLEKHGLKSMPKFPSHEIMPSST